MDPRQGIGLVFIVALFLGAAVGLKPSQSAPHHTGTVATKMSVRTLAYLDPHFDDPYIDSHLHWDYASDRAWLTDTSEQRFVECRLSKMASKKPGELLHGSTHWRAGTPLSTILEHEKDNAHPYYAGLSVMETDLKALWQMEGSFVALKDPPISILINVMGLACDADAFPVRPNP